jgi:hypothetical protein
MSPYGREVVLSVHEGSGAVEQEQKDKHRKSEKRRKPTAHFAAKSPCSPLGPEKHPGDFLRCPEIPVGNETTRKFRCKLLFVGTFEKNLFLQESKPNCFDGGQMQMRHSIHFELHAARIDTREMHHAARRRHRKVEKQILSHRRFVVSHHDNRPHRVHPVGGKTVYAQP